MKKRVFIAYTGGTIGMRRSADGYIPETGLDTLLAQLLPAERATELPDYVLYECSPLLDSANLHPRDWYRIATLIAAHHAEYDGFVVLHGTDTMAYTAAALSFALPGLAKPVIVTGAQIPLREMRNDAHNNLVTALLLATQAPLSEVCLYFNGRLMRGNRATKIKAEALDAFDSPNDPLLGTVGIHIEINRAALLEPQAAPLLEAPAVVDGQMALLKLFPGLSTRLLEQVLDAPLRGLILESYGIGAGPVNQPGFLDTLAAATARGVTLVAISQCREGRVDLGKYAVGSALARAGVLGGFDLTPEAAYTKLSHLLALGLAPELVRARMQTCLRGECSI
ncbi:MAG TPA: asparaginase [Candidatus Competibacteraceae bacterium]|nr:MAG: L-asparaginase 1 [Candidatus Competibacteraceae bacterium]HNW77677.1 asparaginase [Candidatus Competibacteraceae bacterium]